MEINEHHQEFWEWLEFEDNKYKNEGLSVFDKSIEGLKSFKAKVKGDYDQNKMCWSNQSILRSKKLRLIIEIDDQTYNLECNLGEEIKARRSDYDKYHTSYCYVLEHNNRDFKDNYGEIFYLQDCI